MTKEEAKDLYEGKYFYEIVRREDDEITLVGPFDNIFYASVAGQEMTGKHFVQVIDGIPRQFFTEDEILVIDRIL